MYDVRMILSRMISIDYDLFLYLIPITFRRFASVTPSHEIPRAVRLHHTLPLNPIRSHMPRTRRLPREFFFRVQNPRRELTIVNRNNARDPLDSHLTIPARLFSSTITSGF